MAEQTNVLMAHCCGGIAGIEKLKCFYKKFIEVDDVVGTICEAQIDSYGDERYNFFSS